MHCKNDHNILKLGKYDLLINTGQIRTPCQYKESNCIRFIRDNDSVFVARRDIVCMNTSSIQCIFLNHDFGILELPYYFRVTACHTDSSKLYTAVVLSFNNL